MLDLQHHISQPKVSYYDNFIHIIIIVIIIRIVRLSSPTLNYFIIAGTIFMYASIFFFLLPANEMEVIVVRCVVSMHFLTCG